MEGWSEFYVAEVGAAAAIAGLLVVAISINIEKILTQATLPARAAQTLMIIGSALVIGGFGLFPRQSIETFGAEALFISLLLSCTAIIQIRHARQSSARGEPIAWTISPLLVLCMPVVPGVVGGAMLLAANEAGGYVVAVGIILSMVAALLNGWVLLVEILR